MVQARVTACGPARARFEYCNVPEPTRTAIRNALDAPVLRGRANDSLERIVTARNPRGHVLAVASDGRRSALCVGFPNADARRRAVAELLDGRLAVDAPGFEGGRHVVLRVALRDGVALLLPAVVEHRDGDRPPVATVADVPPWTREDLRRYGR